MNVKNLLIAVNPFIDAYSETDFLGKLIFITLITLSVVCWIVLLYKWRETKQAKANARLFYKFFQSQKNRVLALDTQQAALAKTANPFFDLYQVLKKHTLDLLNKNRRFLSEEREGISYLSPTDIGYVESHLFAAVAEKTQQLEKNLYILSTIVSLAPFVGLLGTVWGILMTFSEMQASGSGTSHQMVLGGLSLALATTVMGLLIAIPALIGNNYLRHAINDFQTDMNRFATELLASVEIQYRKVDLA